MNRVGTRRLAVPFSLGVAVASVVALSLWATSVYDRKDTSSVVVSAPTFVEVRGRWASSPGSAVRVLWHLEQQSAPPLAAQLYDRQLRAGIGKAALLDALTIYTANFQSWAPTFTPATETQWGTVVGVTAALASGEHAHFAYVLVQHGKQWRIVYDSMLGDALKQRAQRETQASSRAKGPALTAALLESGDEATRAYQLLAMSLLGRNSASLVRRASSSP